VVVVASAEADLGEETRSEKEQDVGGDDEEDGEVDARTGGVDEVCKRREGVQRA
jgi:hypothetical protein